MLPESLKLAQHYQASYQPGIWWVLNRGSESAHSRGGYSSGFWTVSCCWLLRALGGGRCSAVLFLMEQATFRPACILLHLYQMGLVLSFPKWSQQQQYWIQERAFSTVWWIFTEWNWIFFRKPPDEWSFMPCVNKKNIFYMKSIYSNSSLSSTSQFVRHPKDNSTESNNIHLNLMEQYSPLCLCCFLIYMKAKHIIDWSMQEVCIWFKYSIFYPKFDLSYIKQN